MDAGWQSGILHSEPVLYTENIRVYSPHKLGLTTSKFRTNLNLMHQLNWAIPLNKDTPPIDDNLICPGGVATDFCPGVVSTDCERLS